jgi:hypothetical protein
MKWGLAVVLDDKIKTKLDLCASKGIKQIKLRVQCGLDHKADLNEALKIAKAHGIKVYLSLFDIRTTPVQSDKLFEHFARPSYFSDLMKKILPVAKRELGSDLLAVCLFDGIRYAVRAGMTSKHGLPKKDLQSILQDLSAVAVAHEVLSGIHAFFSDIDSDFWSPVKFDFFDVSGVLSRGQLPHVMKRSKPIWLGDCGVKLVSPVHEKKLYREMNSNAGTMIEYAFVSDQINPSLELLGQVA